MPDNAPQPGPLEEPILAVAHTQADWQEIWTDLYGVNSTAPEMDFTRWRVGIIALATQPTGGVAIGVSKVVESAAVVQMQAVETFPGPDCATLQALTTPVSFTLLPRSNKPVEFFVEPRLEDCA